MGGRGSSVLSDYFGDGYPPLLYPGHSVTTPSGVTPQPTINDRSIVEFFADMITDFHAKLVADMVERLEMLDAAAVAVLDWWDGLSSDDKVRFIFDILLFGSMFVATPGAAGMSVLFARGGGLVLVEMLIGRTNTGLVEKMTYAQAYDAYMVAIATVDSKLAGSLASRGLTLEILAPAQLSRMDMVALQNELNRVIAYQADGGPINDFIAKYQTTLERMVKRERLVGLNKTPYDDPSLPPSTYNMPEPSPVRLEYRIDNPAPPVSTVEENTAVAITQEPPLLVTEPPLSPTALAAQRQSDASLTAGGLSVSGSRSIPASMQNQIDRVAAVLGKSGCEITTGCAGGVDKAFVPYAKHINAIFDSNGNGAISNSNVAAILEAAANGVDVNFLAGGDLSVGVVARLVNRANKTAVSQDTALGIYTVDDSVGTTNTLRTAARNGKNVFALKPGAAGEPPPSIGNGHWQQITKAKGIWETLWQWIVN